MMTPGASNISASACQNKERIRTRGSKNKRIEASGITLQARQSGLRPMEDKLLHTKADGWDETAIQSADIQIQVKSELKDSLSFAPPSPPFAGEDLTMPQRK